MVKTAHSRIILHRVLLGFHHLLAWCSRTSYLISLCPSFLICTKRVLGELNVTKSIKSVHATEEVPGNCEPTGKADASAAAVWCHYGKAVLISKNLSVGTQGLTGYSEPNVDFEVSEWNAQFNLPAPHKM